jgi:acyl-coenzyme A synthetase/AMP-(fatty) acid ligase
VPPIGTDLGDFGARDPHAVPRGSRIVEFIDEIPKNLIGKLLRWVLREREKEKGS